VPTGLFELRRDAITGWWVATVVDRAFERARFRLAAEPVDDGGSCRNCREPPGDGVRHRVLRGDAFHVVGTEDEAGRAGEGAAQLRLGAPRAVGSWSTIVAPPGEHRPLHSVGTELIAALLEAARRFIEATRPAGTTEYVQVVQNWGAQAGARTNHLCFDVYDLPQIPHRVGEELGGAARFVIREGECPFCRLVRDEVRRGVRLVWQDAASVAFAPFASRSPFEVWIVPRHHEADFGRAIATEIRSTAEALRQVLGRLALLDGPPYNLVLHTAPLRERVDQTYHWHWEIHPRLRAIAGLELGTGLPVNPVAPEDAVEELLAAGAIELADGPPSATTWAAGSTSGPAGDAGAEHGSETAPAPSWPPLGGGSGRPTEWAAEPPNDGRARRGGR
jgi:UDPglucose--hexose-1-phosphate uridylyltransferase